VTEPRSARSAILIVEKNSRLTGYVAVVLLAPLLAEMVTGLRTRQFLPAHAFIGLAVTPLVLLKLGSVGYRFARYYTGNAAFREAGPPQLTMRLLGPVIVVLTVVVFGSGIELWMFGYRFGFVWVPVHHASAYLWFVAMLVHVVAYASRAPTLAAADWRDHLQGAFTRRSLVSASVLLGIALAIGVLAYHTPFYLGGGGD
jgi:hypothetical protein